MRIIRDFFRRHPHTHIIKVVDMALGIADVGVPVTAWKYRCILCEHEHEEFTKTGIEQIAKGIPLDEVLQWMSK